MMMFLKFLVGVGLLPLAAALSLLFVNQFEQQRSWYTLAATTQWFIGGFILWFPMFFAFPRPIRTYVLAHELTHALWGLLMGAKVSRLKVSSKGGSVNLTKTNMLITLSPYFFPFYSILALLIYLLVNWQWDMTLYKPFWYALFGMTWAFHLTFTVAMLGIHQPDIHEHGRLFSYVIIYCVNLATAAILLNLLTDQPLRGLAEQLAHHAIALYQMTGLWLMDGAGFMRSRW